MNKITHLLAAVGIGAIGFTAAAIVDAAKIARAAKQPAPPPPPPTVDYALLDLGDGTWIYSCRIDDTTCGHTIRGTWADVAEQAIGHAITTHQRDLAESIARTEAAIFISRDAA